MSKFPLNVGSTWVPSSRPIPGGAAALTGSAILIDCSSSMAAIDDHGMLSRVERVTHVLQTVLAEAPGARVVAFGGEVKELHGLEPGPALQLPAAAGGTPWAKPWRW